jgi:AcrR family transcriptional regulator
VDKRRPGELRDAIVRYLSHHGLAGLSLRPLAKAVGSSPRGLLYHFGSKEKMVIAVLGEVRRRQRATYDKVQAPSFAEACWNIWKKMSAPNSEPLFHLFFEAYGIALRQPRLYRVFLHDTIQEWLPFIAEPLGQEGYPREEARAFATVVLAGLRGFMLDFCTTHDRRRLDRAVGLWLGSLNAMLPQKKAD